MPRPPADELGKGVHRARSAKATCDLVLARLAALEEPILDGYERIERPSGIPQYLIGGTGRYTARVHTPGANGKGHTWDQALASGLMELVERFSSYGHLEALRNARRCPLADLGDNEYGLADLFGCFVKPPLRYLTDDELAAMPLTWFEGRTLSGRRAYLPEALNRLIIQGGNGMAAGNTPDEAVIQALCEVVERHCDTLIRHHRLQTPRIDGRTIDSTVLRGLIGRFEALGHQVQVHDFSLDTGLPVFGVLRVLSDGMVEVTTGVAPWRDEALARTLTESSQGERGPRCLPAAEAATLRQPSGTRSFAEMPSLEGGDLRDEIARFAQRFERLGWRAFVIDTTDPELGLPSVIVDVAGAKYRYPATWEAPTDLVGVMSDADKAGDTATVARCLDLLAERATDIDSVMARHLYAGRLRHDQGRVREATEELETVVEAFGSAPEKDRRLLAVGSASQISGWCAEAGDADGALRWLERARAIRRIAPADGGSGAGP